MEVIGASITNDAFNDKVYGMFLGAFVGDAAGAYLEFYGGTDDDDMIKPPIDVLEVAMQMPGGGYHEIAPGQITDDSEMMMCLIWAYIESNEKVAEGEVKQLDLNLLANRYGDWFNSDPYDIGIATTESI
jgi:ADP-ribosyl-[dinitrogen reductase] hydrolase